MHDETPSTSGINIIRNKDVVEHPEGIIKYLILYTLCTRNSVVMWTFSYQNQARETNHFYLDANISPASGFQVIDISIFEELMFALRYSFCVNET